ncbi:B12-binding domain-containing radical SAM protein [Saccharicrinis sp. FJH62]|uniref:B12-binding domain-containing radical SAM protein n=1 Tax=Saccharicrinis sp. FJH62 TaxID=3344657 RepID=UPI0035D429D4
MKILMVRPRPSSETIGLQHLMIVEPLELEILCALKREGDDVVIIDMILERRPFESFISEHKPDVLCVTGYITNVSTIISYCTIAKKNLPQITTIVGGVHCEVCPEDFDNESIDFRVIRNASSNFTALLNHIDHKAGIPQGILQKGGSLKNMQLPDPDFFVPFPERSAVSKYRDKYFYIFHNKVALIKASFGCPYNCTFCFCRIITSGRYHQRPVAEVIQELEQVHESEIYIVDDDFLVDVKWLRSFIKEIKHRNINKHFLVYGRADFIAGNPEIIHELAKIGLRTVIIGFESFSDIELSRYNKKTSLKIYRKTMDVIHREKLDVFATIIIPPDWDKGDFRNMVNVLKSLKIHFVNLQPLTPLPKTGVTFPEEDIILDKMDYARWDLAHISVRPTKLSVPEFYQEILNAYNAILYNPRVLWKYLISYKPRMLYKMLIGGSRVAKQYKTKIKEVKNHA